MTPSMVLTQSKKFTTGSSHAKKKLAESTTPPSWIIWVWLVPKWSRWLASTLCLAWSYQLLSTTLLTSTSSRSTFLLTQKKQHASSGLHLVWQTTQESESRMKYPSMIQLTNSYLITCIIIQSTLHGLAITTRLLFQCLSLWVAVS